MTRYDLDEEGFLRSEPDGEFVEWEGVDVLYRKISQLQAQLKHNKDRDYEAGFEAGLCAGLNGGA